MDLRKFKISMLELFSCVKQEGKAFMSWGSVWLVTDICKILEKKYLNENINNLIFWYLNTNTKYLKILNTKVFWVSKYKYKILLNDIFTIIKPNLFTSTGKSSMPKY